MIENTKKKAKSKKKRALPAQAFNGEPSGRVEPLAITKSEQTGEALRESAEAYRLIFDRAADAILIHDETGRIRDVNRNACQYLFFSREELLSMSIEDIDLEATRAKINRLRKAVNTGESFMFESRYKRKDGSLLPVEAKLSSIRLAEGPMIIVIARDISARKQEEEKNQSRLAEIQKEKAILSTMIDSIPDELWFADAQGKFTLANPSAIKEFGLDPDRPLDVETLAKSLEVLRPDGSSRPVEEAPPLRALSGEVVRNQEEIVRTPLTTQLRYRQVSSAPVKDPLGRIIGAVSIVRDITELKQAEEALEEIRRAESELLKRLNEAQHIAMIGSWDWDLKTNQVWWSDETYRIFGVRPQDFVPSFEANGRFLHPDDLARYGKSFEHSLQTGEPLDDEFRLIAGDGRLKYCYAKGKTLCNDSGQPIRFIGTILDITESKRVEMALNESARKYQNIFENATEGIFQSTPEGRYISVNPAFAGIGGFDSPEEMINAVTDIQKEMYVHREDRERLLKLLSTQDIVNDFEAEIRRRDGDHIWISMNVRAIKDPSGKIILLEGTIVDITARKRAEELLTKSEKRFHGFADLLPQIVFEIDGNGNLTFANQEGFRSFGYSPADFQSGINILSLITPPDREKIQARLAEILSGAETAPREFQARRKDGGEFPILLHANAILENGVTIGARGIAIDISERKKAEEIVQASLREKEILLREIHHRVKNNMQIISSLLNLQAGQIKDEDARRMLKEGQLRIRSMALVHEKLYHSADLSKINFAEYLNTLSVHLFQYFQIGAGRIRLRTDLEHIYLDINSAVPCGLMVSELVSNALKHAFPEGREGNVEIGLRREKDGNLELRVADDGVGLPDSVDFRSSGSFGLQLVTLLVGQLDGTIELDRKKGAAFTIVFREQEAKARADPRGSLPN